MYFFNIRHIKFRTLVFLSFAVNGLSAQLAEIHLTYEAKFFSGDVHLAYLSIFDDHSISYTSSLPKNQRDKDSVAIEEVETSTGIEIKVKRFEKSFKTFHSMLVRTDRRSEMLSYALIKLKRKREPYFVREKILEMKNWQLYDTTREISGFVCKRATIKFGGRAYEAWYTLDIPTNVGPYKFHGLPGAIVNIEDSTKEVIFKLVQVDYDKFVPKSKKTKFPSNIKPITCNELMELRKEQIRRKTERWEALSDRDFTIKMLSNTINHIQNSCDRFGD